MPAMDRIAANLVYLRVVESGSFSKAAADLGITQPTATKVVAALEKRLGARLLNRDTRGVSPTEIGRLYYEKCKVIQREIDEADSLPKLLQSQVAGVLRVGTSVAFGRRVLTPLLLDFMRAHPDLRVDVSVEDRYVNLVEQGIELAIRMGPLADSTLGARYLGTNPWVTVATPAYLARAGTPREPRDLAAHECLVYSSVQGNDVWHYTDERGARVEVDVRGRFRSNNLSAVLAATRADMGIAILPRYVAREAMDRDELVPILERCQLPSQEIHAVYPSPTLVPSKVSTFVDFARERFGPRWWAT